jgi:hypothetical protein
MESEASQQEIAMDSTAAEGKVETATSSTSLLLFRG